LTNRTKLLYSGLVMDGTRIREPYVPPLVSDYGTLLEMTAEAGSLMHVGMGNGFLVAQASVPLTPPGGPPGGPPPGGPPGDTPPVLGQGGGGEGGDVLDTGGGGGGGGGGETPGGGGGGGGGDVLDTGGGGGGGGGGELPFTGFAAAAVGAVGAGLSAAGLAIRSRLRGRR
jgi:hypothetical protein